MAFRLGSLTVDDPLVGRLRVIGDGYASAGEIPTLLIVPEVQRYLNMTTQESSQAAKIVMCYRDALRRVYADGRWAPPYFDPATRLARQELATQVQHLLGGQREDCLRRLSNRIRDADALFNEEIATRLGLGCEQRSALASVALTNESEICALFREFSNVRLRDSTVMESRALELETAHRQRLLAVLSREQRHAFNILVGTAAMLRPQT